MPLGCRPLECRNVALTTTNASALADEAERLDAPIHARPALAPPVHADLERRRDKTHAFLLTDEPPRDCPPAPPVGRADVQAAIDTLTAESGRTPSVFDNSAHTSGKLRRKAVPTGPRRVARSTSLHRRAARTPAAGRRPTTRDYSATNATSPHS
ncbi:hypothetical protein [Streptomyces sp. NPDC048641]|uniref:hypothetical protein n=1 Tax=Streptomyces sp. NPDC048641 TaxID=3154825 RepID=UPI0034489830